MGYLYWRLTKEHSKVDVATSEIWLQEAVAVSLDMLSPHQQLLVACTTTQNKSDQN